MLTHNNDFLLELLKKMDVPIQRMQDVRWLLRNLSIRNSQHPDFPQVMKILIAESQK